MSSTSEFAPVYRSTLKTMIPPLLNQYGVVGTLERCRFDTGNMFWGGASDINWGPMVAWSPNGVYNLFHECDSDFHSKNRILQPHDYYKESGEMISCLGTEINYYVQGALFRCFDTSFLYADGICGSWKAISGHGLYTPNCQYFTRIGYDDLPSLWPEIYHLSSAGDRAQAYIQHRRMRKSFGKK